MISGCWHDVTLLRVNRMSMQLQRYCAEFDGLFDHQVPGDLVEHFSSTRDALEASSSALESLVWLIGDAAPPTAGLVHVDS